MPLPESIWQLGWVSLAVLQRSCLCVCVCVCTKITLLVFVNILNHDKLRQTSCLMKYVECYYIVKKKLETILIDFTPIHRYGQLSKRTTSRLVL